MREILIASALLALVGLGLEVVFTSILDAIHDPRNRKEWRGYSSPLYIPLYGLSPVVCVLARHVGLHHNHWVWRGLVYMLVIYVVEFSSMWFYRQVFGKSPSEDYYYRLVPKLLFMIHMLQIRDKAAGKNFFV